MLLRNYYKARSAAVGALALAVVFQPCTILAAPSIQSKSTQPPGANVSTTATTSVADIALKPGGILRGQIVNKAGTGLPKATVELTSGRRHWQSKTDAQGWFQFAELRGGTYQFHRDRQTQGLRLWSPGTAPPNASLGLLVTPATDIVRGQNPVSPNTNQFFRVAKKTPRKPVGRRRYRGNSSNDSCSNQQYQRRRSTRDPLRMPRL